MTPVKLKGTASNYAGIALQDSTVLPKLTTKNSSFEKKASSPSLGPLIDTCQKCSTSPANHEPRSPANGSFQNPGVCPQAVPSFPSPTPTVFFGSRPIFRAGKIPKTPFLGLSLFPNSTETLATQASRFHMPLHPGPEWRIFHMSPL